MTYRELYDKLSTLSDVELDCNVEVEYQGPDWGTCNVFPEDLQKKGHFVYVLVCD